MCEVNVGVGIVDYANDRRNVNFQFLYTVQTMQIARIYITSFTKINPPVINPVNGREEFHSRIDISKIVQRFINEAIFLQSVGYKDISTGPSYEFGKTQK